MAGAIHSQDTCLETVMGFRPKRFDVAGAHPDEAWRAVSNIADAVKEIDRAMGSSPNQSPDVSFWLDRKPLRFGTSLDYEVQRFLESGVKIMDRQKVQSPLGLSRSHEEIRNRCNELAKSMQKVLDKRPDEQRPFDPWQKVRIYLEPCPLKDDRLNVLTGIEMRQKCRQILKSVFQRPADAAHAMHSYHAWEETAERLQNNPAMPEKATQWKTFLDKMEAMRMRDGHRGVVWGLVEGFDYSEALVERPQFRPRPRQRM